MAQEESDINLVRLRGTLTLFISLQLGDPNPLDDIRRSLFESLLLFLTPSEDDERPWAAQSNRNLITTVHNIESARQLVLDLLYLTIGGEMDFTECEQRLSTPMESLLGAIHPNGTAEALTSARFAMGVVVEALERILKHGIPNQEQNELMRHLIIDIESGEKKRFFNNAMQICECASEVRAPFKGKIVSILNLLRQHEMRSRLYDDIERLRFAAEDS